MAIKRFYFYAGVGYSQKIHQVVDQIEREYNSPVTQNMVKNNLKSLLASKFVGSGMETASVFERVYEIITKLSRQSLVAHRGDSHKVKYLLSERAGFQ